MRKVSYIFLKVSMFFKKVSHQVYSSKGWNCGTIRLRHVSTHPAFRDRNARRGVRGCHKRFRKPNLTCFALPTNRPCLYYHTPQTTLVLCLQCIYSLRVCVYIDATYVQVFACMFVCVWFVHSEISSSSRNRWSGVIGKADTRLPTRRPGKTGIHEALGLHLIGVYLHAA